MSMWVFAKALEAQRRPDAGLFFALGAISQDAIKKASDDELTEEYVEVREEETATTSPRRTSLRSRDKKGEKADKTGVAHKKNQNGCEHTKRECFQTETSGVYFDETWREQETAKGKGGDLLDINCMDCGRDVRLETVDDDCEAE